MSGLDLRPRTDSLLRKWGQMIQERSSGHGYDLETPRQERFLDRIDQFRSNPRPETFDAIWTADVTVEADNPGGPILRTSFRGDCDALASFIESLAAAESFDDDWEDRVTWKWSLWELYTRLNDAVPVVLTSESVAALSWLGVEPTGDFRSRLATLAEFRDHYESLLGHPTESTDHRVSIKTELDEFCHVLRGLDWETVAAEVNGPYGDFYRLLYGGSVTARERSGPVELQNVSSIVAAYAWGKANDAYDRPEAPSYWGGTYWETWKESYAAHVEATICERFTLDDIQPTDIEPLFEALTDADASNLGRSVASHVMGSQWGQYTWNDVVDHLTANPTESSRVLSVFFDQSLPVEDRLRAFKAHTIHLTETDDRSPGSLERMATSLLMFTEPSDHLGLPSRRTRQFVEEYTTLSSYDSGFRPQQYGSIIGPLRGLRDEVERVLSQHGHQQAVTMLDVHTMIWIYGGEGAPSPDEVPTGIEDW